MISATVLDITQSGTQAVLRYRLIEDSTNTIVSEGSLNVTGTPDDITADLANLVDVANYVASLQPLVKTVVKSAVIAPDPVSLPPINEKL